MDEITCDSEQKKSITEVLVAIVLALATTAYLLYFQPPDYVVKMELGRKLFDLSIYTLYTIFVIMSFGGFGFDVISHLKTSRRTTAILLGAWIIGGALVIHG